MKSSMRSIVVAVALVAGTFITPAWSALDMALKIDTIDGESTWRNHKGWIDVLAWSWGASNSGSIVGGQGKPDLQDFSFTQYVDTSFVPLFTGLTTGEHFTSATLDVIKAGDRDPYLKMTFTDVMLTSLSLGGGGGEDRLTANTSFAFSKVDVEYRQRMNDGSYGPPIKGGYSISSNAAIFGGNAAVIRFSALASPDAVPEAQTWALMLGGLAMAGLMVRRRSNG